jgi:predicted DCC family thiol-disulfide oxidoreductase YuxK
MSTPTLTLFYDGLCPLCSREVAHYRRRAAGDPSVSFIDITDPAFDPAAHGLDRERIHRVMHVKAGDEMLTGLDAFIALWGRIRGWGWLARFAGLPGVYTLMKLGYGLFARVRPWLPRRKARCATGVCRR